MLMLSMVSDGAKLCVAEGDILPTRLFYTFDTFYNDSSGAKTKNASITRTSVACDSHLVSREQEGILAVYWF